MSQKFSIFRDGKARLRLPPRVMRYLSTKEVNTVLPPVCSTFNISMTDCRSLQKPMHGVSRPPGEYQRDFSVQQPGLFSLTGVLQMVRFSFTAPGCVPMISAASAPTIRGDQLCTARVCFLLRTVAAKPCYPKCLARERHFLFTSRNMECSCPCGD